MEGFRKKVVAYELVGNECIQRTEKVPLPQQIVAGLPSGGQVVQVGGIAVIATSSALLAKPLADLLLKAVKPAVKKVMKKIAALRGKKPPVLSAGERRADQRQMCIRDRLLIKQYRFYKVHTSQTLMVVGSSVRDLQEISHHT